MRRTDTATVQGTVTAIAVTTGSGDVTVATGVAGSPVTVTTRRSWSFTEATGERTLVDGTLRLAARCPGGDLLSRCRVGWTLTVPAGIAVTVTTSVGDVRVSGVGGPVAVRTGAGDVRLDRLRSDRVRVRTGTGDVTAGFVAAPGSVSVHADAGDVAVRLPAGGTGYRVTGTTGAGDRAVEVPLDSRSSHVVEVRTGTGDVVVGAA